jgi:Trk K+ transport system NAD-binding subunit
VIEGYGRFHFTQFKRFLLWFQTEGRLPEQQPVDIGNAKIVIMGMGRVGLGAYEYLSNEYGDVVVGFDDLQEKMQEHCDKGRRVLLGDASDRELWERIPREQVEQVILALSNHRETMMVAKLLREKNYQGVVAAVAKYPDEVEELKALDVIAFNFYAEVGAGFAEHVHHHVAALSKPA